ncbi:MAG: phosphatase PAP2 family protein [Planctomycetota bacterium]
MKNSTLARFAAAAAAVTLIGILLVDRPIANWVHGSGIEGLSFFSKGTEWLDLICGREVSKYLLGGVIGGVGLVCLARRTLRRSGVGCFFVAVTLTVSVLLTGTLKNVFGRLRPHELFEKNLDGSVWFAKGSSFPSGHSAYYFGLFLPLAYLFPKWRWPLLIVPFFIAAARINEGHHFLSDVTGSMVLVSCFALIFATALGRWLRFQPGTSDVLQGGDDVGSGGEARRA